MIAQRQDRFLLISVFLLSASLTLASLHAQGASASHEYDAQGRLSRITYDDGTVIEYAYDGDGTRL